jgi:Zn-dependent protease/CBS domain-containing protein
VELKWSLKVGKFAGTFVYVHVTFFILLAWIAVTSGLEKGSLTAAVQAAGFTTTLFGCVVLHEFGHALMARRFGIRTRDIVLLPIGGVGRLERIPEVPTQEFLVALAGPAVSVGIAAGLFVVLRLYGSAPRLEEFGSGEAPFAERLMFINAGLAMFNLLPAFPMDGGRVLRSALAMRLDYLRATEVAARIGQAVAVLFVAVGVLTNPLLVLIALFVWMGAAGEVGVLRVKRALGGATVESAMRTEFGELVPGDTLQRAAEMAIHHAQSDFPVLLDGRVVGMLTRRDLARHLSEEGGGRLVGDVMHRSFETVGRSERLEAVVARLEQAPGTILLVMDRERLIGLLGLEEITNLLRITRAAATRRPDAVRRTLGTMLT